MRTQVSVYRGADPEKSVRGKIDLVGIQDGRCVVLDLKCRNEGDAPERSHAVQAAIYAALVDLQAPLARAPVAYVLNVSLRKGIAQLFRVDCSAIATGLLDTEPATPRAAAVWELMHAWEARRDREGLPSVVSKK